MTITEFKDKRTEAAIKIQELIAAIAEDFEDEGVILTGIDITIRMHKSFGNHVAKSICSEVDLKFDI
jgi:hypothetical protein